MGKNQEPIASSMVGFLRDLINEEIAKQDSTEICQITEDNGDGTYNIVLLPDEKVILSKVKSISPEALAIGEYAYIYKFKNQLNNAIILSRLGSNGDLRFVSTKEAARYVVSESSGGGGEPSSPIDFASFSEVYDILPQGASTPDFTEIVDLRGL